MLRNTLRGAAYAAAATLVLTLSGQAAFAAASDYRFDLVSARPAGPGKTDVTLRLVYLPDAKPVPDAIIFQPLVVMAGMESMPGNATAHPGPEAGTYVLHAATSMAGPWTLRLSAKVQGETETVRSAVAFEAGQ
ncbi:MAG: FixH family protein [Rhodopila sp.]|nr:FixH family protein [Rhodopila sp.]